MKRAASFLVLAVACRNESKPPSPSPAASAAPARAASAARRAAPDPRIAQGAALVQRWQAAQNEQNFAAYSALYAAAFQGTKRVGERSFRFDKRRWLMDRQAMFVPGLKVEVSHLQVATSGQKLVAFFEQTFSTPSYRDRGRKLLAFAPTAAGFEIVREELLTSQVLGGGGSVRSLPGFFYARPDGVVLRSSIDENWLTPARRELSRRVREAHEQPPDNPDDYPSDEPLRPEEVKLPPEVTAFEGKSLFVTRVLAPHGKTLPAPCEASVKSVTVVSAVAPNFDSVRGPWGYDQVFGNVVLGRFESPCPGALWASETPPGTQYLPEKVGSALQPAVERVAPVARGFGPLALTRVGDLLFARATRLAPDGEERVVNLLLRGTTAEDLKLLGELAPYAVPRLGFKLDGDETPEVLTYPQDSFSTVQVLSVRDSINAVTVYEEPEFVCPG